MSERDENTLPVPVPSGKATGARLPLIPPPPIAIPRDAGGSAKGPRLQRLRAARFILEAMSEPETVQAYAAVEAFGDTFVAKSTASLSSAYAEENKNYDPDRSFSFLTEEVINSVVIFADEWIKWNYSTKLRFGLYTTAGVGKERHTSSVLALGIALPQRPLLEYLFAGDFTEPLLLPALKALVIEEYATQYKESRHAGHLAALRQWTDDTWMAFFGQIRWLFCEGNEAVAEARLVEAVEKSPLFTSSLEGRSKVLAAALVDMFDKRQSAADFSERFVHRSDVALLFNQVESGEVGEPDPTWKSWSALPSPTDGRNVAEKLTAVCPTITKRVLSTYVRKTTDGHAEWEAHAQDKNTVAMRYQIFDACGDALRELGILPTAMTQNDLDSHLDHLVRRAVERVNSRADEYGYRHRSEAFVRGLVLTLFDSCFLALDEAE